MSTKITAFKRAVKAAKASMGPQRYGIHGKPFVCLLCGHDRFNPAPNLLTWNALACAECGRLEFFEKAPELISPGR